MDNLFTKFWTPAKTEDAMYSITTDNSDIIEIFYRMRYDGLIPEDEPNIQLAKKVFLDFNEFNLRNIEEIQGGYLDFIPRSLLPYPKNYIQCAESIYEFSLEKKKDIRMLNNAKNIGLNLYYNYPNYKKYEENLKHKGMIDDLVFKNDNPIPRESFKKIYGSYQISKEQYEASPNSSDATQQKLIYDFGVSPEAAARFEISLELEDDD